MNGNAPDGRTTPAPRSSTHPQQQQRRGWLHRPSGVRQPPKGQARRCQSIPTSGADAGGGTAVAEGCSMMNGASAAHSSAAWCMVMVPPSIVVPAGSREHGRGVDADTHQPRTRVAGQRRGRGRWRRRRTQAADGNRSRSPALPRDSPSAASASGHEQGRVWFAPARQLTR